MKPQIISKANYIGALKECLSARSDFNDLEYFRDRKTADEYLILSDIVGHIFILNITGYKGAMIYHALAQIECGIIPDCFISDKAEQMRIAKLRQAQA